MIPIRLASILIARPAIYNFVFEISPDYEACTNADVNDIAEANKWGWVNIWELIPCLHMFHTSFIGHPIDVVRRFEVLNRKNGVRSFTWATLCTLSVGEKSLPTKECIVDKFYVPALWANNVIDLARQGVYRIIHETQHPNGTYTVGTTDKGKKVLVQVGKNWVIRDE